MRTTTLLLSLALMVTAIGASAQSASKTNLKISTLSGEEFSCLLSEVALIKLRGDFADIVSTSGDRLFSFQLFSRRNQTIVLADGSNSTSPNPDQGNEPEHEHGHSVRPTPERPDIETSADCIPAEKPKVNLYPNPSSGIIRISNAGDNPEIKVISMSGAVVLTARSCEADLSDLKPGTYIITVNNQAFKVIKE